MSGEKPSNARDWFERDRLARESLQNDGGSYPDKYRSTFTNLGANVLDKILGEKPKIIPDSTEGGSMEPKKAEAIAEYEKGFADIEPILLGYGDYLQLDHGTALLMGENLSSTPSSSSMRRLRKKIEKAKKKLFSEFGDLNPVMATKLADEISEGVLDKGAAMFVQTRIEPDSADPNAKLVKLRFAGRYDQCTGVYVAVGGGINFDFPFTAPFKYKTNSPAGQAIDFSVLNDGGADAWDKLEPGVRYGQQLPDKPTGRLSRAQMDFISVVDYPMYGEDNSYIALDVQPDRDLEAGRGELEMQYGITSLLNDAAHTMNSILPNDRIFDDDRRYAQNLRVQSEEKLLKGYRKLRKSIGARGLVPKLTSLMTFRLSFAKEYDKIENQSLFEKIKRNFLRINPRIEAEKAALKSLGELRKRLKGQTADFVREAETCLLLKVTPKE